MGAVVAVFMGLRFGLFANLCRTLDVVRYLLRVRVVVNYTVGRRRLPLRVLHRASQ